MLYWTIFHSSFLFSLSFIFWHLKPDTWNLLSDFWPLTSDLLTFSHSHILLFLSSCPLPTSDLWHPTSVLHTFCFSHLLVLTVLWHPTPDTWNLLSIFSFLFPIFFFLLIPQFLNSSIFTPWNLSISCFTGASILKFINGIPLGLNAKKLGIRAIHTHQRLMGPLFRNPAVF